MRSNVSGVGFYNSEPRNFNRGYGRGNPRPYQSSQPPPSPQPQRKGDLFVEAGRLAVEYLVSHGLLSSDVIPGKSQDHSNSQDQGISKSPSGVSSDQRSLNGHDMIMSRNYSGEKGKYEASRSYSSDFSQENGTVMSLPEKTSSPNTMDVDNDKYHKDGYKEENSEICANKEGSHHDAKHETEICHPLIDSDSKVAFSLEDKDNKELFKSFAEAKEEAKDGPCNLDHEQKVQLSENNNEASPKEKTNLSKVHCFLSDKSLKQEPVLIGEEMNVNDTGRDFLNSVNHDKMNGSSGITSSSEISGANCPDNALSDHPFRRVGPVNALSDHPFTCEKRAHEEGGKTEGAKKARSWLSVAQSNEYPEFSDMSEKNPISPEKRDATICNEPTDHKSFHIVSLPLQGGDESAMDRREEKQLFSSSYKICDLNLMEGSDMHEGHVVGSLLYPSLSAPKKEAQIDIDLSMSNNFSTFMSDYNVSGSVRKNVEIIDLESSSMEEGKDSNFPTKSEGGITSMVNFADNQQHTNDNADGQDKYGLMISELLGNDDPNCSTAQPDINSLQNDMGMHHGEGIFTEDDPIYMSLGEIPLTGLLQGWEQPTQERNPFQL